MIPALKKQVKAAEYRRFAAQATALAAASPLDHVREKHQLAADRWGALAALEEAPSDAGVVRAPWPRRDRVTPRIPPPAEDGCVA